MPTMMSAERRLLNLVAAMAAMIMMRAMMPCSGVSHNTMRTSVRSPAKRATSGTSMSVKKMIDWLSGREPRCVDAVVLRDNLRSPSSTAS